MMTQWKKEREREIKMGRTCPTAVKKYPSKPVQEDHFLSFWYTIMAEIDVTLLDRLRDSTFAARLSTLERQKRMDVYRGLPPPIATRSEATRRVVEFALNDDEDDSFDDDDGFDRHRPKDTATPRATRTRGLNRLRRLRSEHVVLLLLGMALVWYRATTTRRMVGNSFEA